MKRFIRFALLAAIVCLPTIAVAQQGKPIYISLPGPGNVQH